MIKHEYTVVQHCPNAAADKELMGLLQYRLSAATDKVLIYFDAALFLRTMINP